MRVKNVCMTPEEEIRRRDEHVLQALKALRMPGMAEYYRRTFVTCAKAPDSKTTPQGFIEAMVDEQLRQSGENRKARNLRKAGLWHGSASFDNLDAKKSSLPPATLAFLRSCSFVADGGFVVITGPAKSGATYLACAIGSSACALRLSTKYYRYTALVQELADANREGRLTAKLGEVRSCKCLIIDGWCDQVMDDRVSVLMKEIIDFRPGTGGTILVSHAPVSEWQDKAMLPKELGSSLFLTTTRSATIVSLF